MHGTFNARYWTQLAFTSEVRVMSVLLAIDPGNRESGYAIVDTTDGRPITFGKIPNDEVLAVIAQEQFDHVAIEQIGHYGTGMPAGRDVFDTCRWIGRFEQALFDQGLSPQLVLRASVKTHLCGAPKAKDSNVVQALVDRFAHGQPNHGKGTKANPGWFYGFYRDAWQSYALAIYVADRMAAQ